MKGSKALWITLVMAAGLIALAVGLRGPLARLTAERWRSELATVSDDRVGILLGRVADLGETGIPVLVDALASERASLARAASQVLSEQLNCWQNLSAASGVEKQAVLADALANRVVQFGPTARSDAADLAARILLWLPDSTAVDRGRIIASCEKVLRAGSADRREPAAEETAGPGVPPQQLPPPMAGSTAQPPRRRGELHPLEASLTELTRFPGGGLPIDGLPSSAVQPSAERVESSPSADISATRPQLLVGPSGARPLGPLQQPRPLSAFSGDWQTPPETKIPSYQSQEVTAVKPLSGTEAPEGFGQPASRANLAAVETTELMRRLRAQDKGWAAEARAELVRRGLGEVHLDLARRLFDPDPKVRQELARLLPGLQSVDAVPWLLWLGCDEEPEVRLLAITLMATTGDRAVWEQIEKMARKDPDPRIQELADRLGRQRNERPR